MGDCKADLKMMPKPADIAIVGDNLAGLSLGKGIRPFELRIETASSLLGQLRLPSPNSFRWRGRKGTTARPRRACAGARDFF